MKEIVYKYKYGHLALLFIIIITTALIMYNLFNEDHSDKSIDPTRPGITESSNKILYSLYHQNGDLIDNGSPLTPNNGKINKTVSLNHFIDEKKYALLVLVDFKHMPFKVNNQEYETYEFGMKPNSKVNIETHVNVKKSSKEIDYLIIKKPDYLLKEKDIRRASVLQEVKFMRYPLKNKNQKTIEVDFQKPLKELVVVQ